MEEIQVYDIMNDVKRSVSNGRVTGVFFGDW